MAGGSLPFGLGWLVSPPRLSARLAPDVLHGGLHVCVVLTVLLLASLLLKAIDVAVLALVKKGSCLPNAGFPSTSCMMPLHIDISEVRQLTVTNPGKNFQPPTLHPQPSILSCQKRSNCRMSQGQNSLKGGYVKDYMGTTIWVIKGDTRSLDYSSYERFTLNTKYFCWVSREGRI